MRTKHLFHTINLGSILLAYFLGIIYIMVLPLVFLIFILLIEYSNIKFLRRFWWKVMAKRELKWAVSANALIGYPMLIWIDLGDAEEQYINNTYWRFQIVVKKKLDEICDNYSSYADKVGHPFEPKPWRKRFAYLKDTHYKRLDREQAQMLTGEENDFIDSIQNDKSKAS